MPRCRPPPGSFYNFVYQYGQPVANHAYHIRIDHKLSDKQTLFSSFGRVRVFSDNWGTQPSHSDGYTNGLPNEYLSLRDDLSRQVTNPFYGLIEVGNLSRTTVAKSQLLLPYPHYAGLTIAFRPIGSSWYDSLQATINRRFGKGISMLGSYTFSKEMEKRRFLNATDPLERSIAVIDRPHRLIYSGQWSLPVGKNKTFGRALPGAVDKVGGDWELTWVATFHSGMPTGPWANAIQTRDPQQITQTVDKWFDTGAFAAAPSYTLRYLPFYNSHIRGDGMQKLDLSIAKDISIGEAKLRIFMQMFNAFNTPQFAMPNLTVTSPAFGSITAQANLPRVIMFSGSFHF